MNIAEEYIGANAVQNIVRSSDWITVSSLGSGGIAAKQALHGELIPFPGLYLGQKEIAKITDIRIKQSATLTTGASLVTAQMLLLLFNTNAFTPTRRREITIPSNYYDTDIIARIPILTATWENYITGYSENLTQPNQIIEGSINDANLGVDIYGILLADAPLTLLATSVFKIKIITQLLKNANNA